MRGRAYHRAMREKSIKRKLDISKDYWYVKYPGMLDKGKIHCSCWMCSVKSKTHGCPHSELRKEIGLEYD